MSPTRIQWPTLNGFSLWMARPAKALPSVSCSAKPITTALTADVVRAAGSKTNVRRQQDQADDDGVLENDREAIGHAIDAQRIDEEEDRRVDQRRRRSASCRRRPAAVCVSGESGRPTAPGADVDGDVADEQDEREPQLAPDEPVDRQAHDPERRGQSPRRPGSGGRDSEHRQAAIPFLNASSSAGVTFTAAGSCSGPPLASRSGTPPRAPADAGLLLDCVCLLAGDAAQQPNRLLLGLFLSSRPPSCRRPSSCRRRRGRRRLRRHSQSRSTGFASNVMCLRVARWPQSRWPSASRP